MATLPCARGDLELARSALTQLLLEKVCGRDAFLDPGARRLLPARV